MNDERTVSPLPGKTLRWTFTEGPMPEATYQHVFHDDGTVVWTVIEGAGKGKSAREKDYSAVKIAERVYAVSYLAASGYTLTVVLNFAEKTVFGFASNEKEWYPLKGTFETIE